MTDQAGMYTFRPKYDDTTLVCLSAIVYLVPPFSPCAVSSTGGFTHHFLNLQLDELKSVFKVRNFGWVLISVGVWRKFDAPGRSH